MEQQHQQQQHFQQQHRKKQNQQTKRKGGALLVGPKETILEVLEKVNKAVEIREKSAPILDARKKLSDLYKETGSQEKYTNLKSDDRRLFLHRKLDILPNVVEQSQFIRFYALPIGKQPENDAAIIKEMEEREKKAIEGTQIKIDTSKKGSLNLDRLGKIYSEFFGPESDVKAPESYYYIYGLEPGSPLYAHLVGYLGKTADEKRFVGAFSVPRSVGNTNEHPWEVMLRNLREEVRLDLGDLGTLVYQKYLQNLERVPRKGLFNLLTLPTKDKITITYDEKENMVKLALHATDPVIEVIKAAKEQKEEEGQQGHHYNRGGNRGGYNNNRGGGSYNNREGGNNNYNNNRGGGYNNNRGGGYNNNRDGGNNNSRGGNRGGYNNNRGGNYNNRGRGGNRQQQENSD